MNHAQANPRPTGRSRLFHRLLLIGWALVALPHIGLFLIDKEEKQ